MHLSKVNFDGNWLHCWFERSNTTDPACLRTKSITGCSLCVIDGLRCLYKGADCRKAGKREYEFHAHMYNCGLSWKGGTYGEARVREGAESIDS